MREKRRKVKEGKEINDGDSKFGEEWWRLVGVYVNRDFKGKMRNLREWIEEREERMTVLIGQDFNA